VDNAGRNRGVTFCAWWWGAALAFETVESDLTSFVRSPLPLASTLVLSKETLLKNGTPAPVSSRADPSYRP
jgi:hypothetical protein